MVSEPFLDKPSELMPIVHGNARIIKSTPSDSQVVIVQTAIEPWSYAASFKLSLPDELKDDLTERLRVVVDLQVESGLIGIGCLNDDLTLYVDRELELPAGSRRKVYVSTGEHGSAASLMIRNANMTGGCSRVHVYGVETRWVKQEEERYERLRRTMSPRQLSLYERYRPSRVFAVVSWGAAATYWLAARLNDCPGIFCVHAANLFWEVMAEAKYLSGVYYMQVVGMQGHAALAAGDVHGVSRADIPEISEFFGDAFRAAVLVREPQARLRSQLAVFDYDTRASHVDCSYLDSMYPEVLMNLPTRRHHEYLFVHAANMLNAVIEEAKIAPIFRMEDVVQKPDSLKALVVHLTAGTVVPPDDWVDASVNIGAKNRHSRADQSPWAPWQQSVLRSVVKPDTIAHYRDLGYDMEWLLKLRNGSQSAP